MPVAVTSFLEHAYVGEAICAYDEVPKSREFLGRALKDGLARRALLICSTFHHAGSNVQYLLPMLMHISRYVARSCAGLEKVRSSEIISALYI